ncbi:MAG: hypothetical protein AB8B87_17090 [Granulosicoccus sp.]
MNTTAHLLLGTAAFGRENSRNISIAALLGALVPDVSLYVLCGVSILILGISPQVVFDELYFSNSWQKIFSIDNSFVLWSVFLFIAVKRKQPVLIAFVASALLHVLTDFMMHHDDARAHFWPLSDWRFASPISYWDSAHHAAWVAPLEGLLATICGFVLWRRHTRTVLRVSLVVLLLTELLIIRQWLVFF